MLTAADDYPLHQTPEPMAFAGGERNFYDRFFFNGYDAKADIFFALALGVYPQLGIMDAAFALRYQGKQYNIRASKEMNGDRLDLEVGGIKLTIIKPLQETLIIVQDVQAGLTAHLTASAAHTPIEEPRFTRRHGTRLLMDYTRATQNITWQGTIEHAANTIDVAGFCGTRDRSWGIRAIGAAEAQPLVPPRAGQFYWLWAPLHLQSEDGSQSHFFIHSNDDENGAGWNRHAQFYNGQTDSLLDFKEIDFTAQYKPATRRIERLEARFDGYHLDLTPLSADMSNATFYMQGLGYLHPEWGHGIHKGATARGFDRIDLREAEAKIADGQIHNIHIQLPVCATLTPPASLGVAPLRGFGVLEQLFIGPHAPSGFRDVLDGYGQSQ